MMTQSESKRTRAVLTSEIRSFPSLHNFQVTEAYHTLRTNILFALPQDTCRKILFCSPNPSEGKTTTSVNTAIAIAMTEAKVLLIDCDFRRPRVHTYFQQSNRVGISNFLSGMCVLKDSIKHTQYDNLSLMPTGLIPPNPSELLSCENMKKVIQIFEKSYDYIIIDSPPINVVSDALSLVPVLDGVILVIRQNETRHPELKKALAAFAHANANMLGVVINDLNAKKGSYKEKYYRKYSDEL